MADHSIDDMAKAGFTSARGVRYWEDQGLLGVVERTSGNQRRYTDEQMERAGIIAAAQFGQFTLEQCKEMLEGWNMEAYEAILYRLTQQVACAAQLSENLPVPPEKPEKVYDL